MGAALCHQSKVVTKAQAKKWSGRHWNSKQFASMADKDGNITLDQFFASLKASTYGLDDSVSWHKLEKVFVELYPQVERGELVDRHKHELEECFASESGIVYTELKASVDDVVRKGKLIPVMIEKKPEESLGLIVSVSPSVHFMGWTSEQFISCEQLKRFPDGRVGPAQKAGLRRHDVILRVDGHPIASNEDFMKAISTTDGVRCKMLWEIARVQVDDVSEFDFEITKRTIIEDVIKHCVLEATAASKFSKARFHKTALAKAIAKMRASYSQSKLESPKDSPRHRHKHKHKKSHRHKHDKKHRRHSKDDKETIRSQAKVVAVKSREERHAIMKKLSMHDGFMTRAHKERSSGSLASPKTTPTTPTTPRTPLSRKHSSSGLLLFSGAMTSNNQELDAASAALDAEVVEPVTATVLPEKLSLNNMPSTLSPQLSNKRVLKPLKTPREPVLPRRALSSPSKPTLPKVVGTIRAVKSLSPSPHNVRLNPISDSNRSGGGLAVFNGSFSASTRPMSARSGRLERLAKIDSSQWMGISDSDIANKINRLPSRNRAGSSLMKAPSSPMP